MSGKLYLTPYGVGLGHASRLINVAQRLKKDGWEIFFSSFGEVPSYVRSHGFNCLVVPPVEFAWNREGSFSTKESLANVPLWFTNFSRQINQEIRNISTIRPDVVVSDSRLSSVLAAKLIGVPTIVVLNQVKLLFSPRLREFRISRYVETMTGEFLGLLWNAADRLLIPDLPPPYTLAAHNLWDVSSISSRIEYIGFTSLGPCVREEEVARVAKQLHFDGSRPIIFFHVSGPRDTRPPLVRLVKEASKYLDDKMHYVISEGTAGGDQTPKRLGTSGWSYEWCPVRDELFAMSDALVLRGGHVALSQAIQFGKPVVTIPIESQGEQLGNSEKMSKLGLGIMLRPKDLKPEKIAEAVSCVISNSTYKARAQETKKVAEGLDGINTIVRLVNSYRQIESHQV